MARHILDFEKTPGYVLSGLKRDELTALNSTLLHELYFASMGGEGGKPPAQIAEALMRNLDWKSVEERYEDATKVNPPRPLEQPEFGGPVKQNV